MLLDHCGLFNPCQNGGICVQQNFDYYCMCVDGHVGKNCDRGETSADDKNILF